MNKAIYQKKKSSTRLKYHCLSQEQKLKLNFKVVGGWGFEWKRTIKLTQFDTEGKRSFAPLVIQRNHKKKHVKNEKS